MKHFASFLSKKGRLLTCSLVNLMHEEESVDVTGKGQAEAASKNDIKHSDIVTVACAPALYLQPSTMRHISFVLYTIHHGVR